LSFCFYPGSNEEVQAVASLAYVLLWWMFFLC
jgi:hypothetical protein